MYVSTKTIGGFSTCFRQWKAKGTHCKFLHGYAMEFHMEFESETLDERNWVQDFGFLSRTEFKMDGYQLKEWFKYMFDHTTIIAYDDPYKELFKGMADEGLIQLRIMDNTGCEKFAELVYSIVSLALKYEQGEMVKLRKVTCIETPFNTASYEG